MKSEKIEAADPRFELAKGENPAGHRRLPRERSARYACELKYVTRLPLGAGNTRRFRGYLSHPPERYISLRGKEMTTILKHSVPAQDRGFMASAQVLQMG